MWYDRDGRPYRVGSAEHLAMLWLEEDNGMDNDKGTFWDHNPPPILIFGDCAKDGGESALEIHV